MLGRERLLGKPGIPPDELLSYLEDASKAIDYLNSSTHDMGSGPVAIQHCDIKPQNILIVGGAAQVCDFGLARVLSGDVRTSIAAASPAYAAPECLRDNKPSQSTDQYSLAISYVELRTGSLPFDNDSFPAVMNAHLEGKLDLSQLPEPERQVIRRATAAHPADRFPSALEMVRALQRARQQSISGPIRSAVASGAILPGAELVPGYKLVNLLGRGGFGEVWLASAPGGRPVALKIIRNLQNTKGKREFRALELIKGVDHNHLMEVHAFWLLDHDGTIIPDDVREKPGAPTPHTLVIASKLAEKNLLQRLEECRMEAGGGIPIPELLNYMRQAADALDYLNAPQHPLGDQRVAIQHRDIKPENILLSGSTVKIGDFGLAKVVEGTAAVIHADSRGLTLAYAAPELFEGQVTAWTDQYSLAITYIQLRTGSLPFGSGSSLFELIEAHRQGKLDLHGLLDAERQVIARATAVVPENRFASCTDMVNALEAAVAEGGAAQAKRPEVTATTGRASPGITEGLAVTTDATPDRMQSEASDAPFGLTLDSAGQLVENSLEQQAAQLLEQLRSVGVSAEQILAELELLPLQRTNEGRDGSAA
jgi:serine/threonine protein kinase